MSTKFILATAAGGLALFTAGAAGAASTGESAKTVLDELWSSTRPTTSLVARELAPTRASRPNG